MCRLNTHFACLAMQYLGMAMFSLSVAMHYWCWYCLDNAPCMYKNRRNELLSDVSGGIGFRKRNSIRILRPILIFIK